jgi:hypothetical protein
MKAVFVKVVPPGVPAGTCPTRVKTPSLPIARTGFVQLTEPPAPGAGVEHVQPAGAESETKVIVPGSASFNVAASAVSGPPLMTVIV